MWKHWFSLIKSYLFTSWVASLAVFLLFRWAREDIFLVIHWQKRQFTQKRRNGLTMKSLRSYLVLLITSLHTVILQVVLLELSLLVFAYLYSEYSIKGRLMLRLANFCINLTTALPLTNIVTQRGYICMYVF